MADENWDWDSEATPGAAPPASASTSGGSAWDSAEGFAAAKPAASGHGALREFGDQAAMSAMGMGQGLLGFVSATSRALGADPDTVGWIEKQKATVAAHVAATYDGLSPAAQKAAQASMFGGKDASGQDLPSPGEAGWGRYIAANAASAIPMLALAMLPGGIAGRVTSALAFGAVDAGEAYNHMVEAVDKASPDQMMTSPVYAHLRESGTSDLDARKSVIAQTAPAFMAARFAVGTAGGAGIGGLLTKGALSAGATRLLTRAGIGAAEGAGVMGAQAGADTALEQQGDISAGTREGFDPHELALRVASGVLGGAVVGAAGGALHRAPKAKEPAPVTLPADHTAALDEALGQTQPPPKSDPEPTPVGPTPPTSPTEPTLTAAPAAEAPAETPAAPMSMSRKDLIDALAATGIKQQTLNRMSAKDLQARFDKLNPTKPAEEAPVPTVPTVVDAPAAKPAEEVPASAPVAETPVVPTVVAPEIVKPAETPSHVDVAASQAHPEPTPAQAEAGNYQKGHANVGGLDVSIETPAGGVRRGVGPDGKPWEATMPAHYGYIKRTEGADGDHLDVSLGPDAHQADQHPVWVVDQIDPKARTFDEHKAQVGFAMKEAALAAYDGSFSDGSGPARRGAVTEMPFAEFKAWTKTEDTTKALAWKPTKGDELRAKRAAEKAKMAAPGERVKGVVATSEGEDKAPTVVAQPKAEPAIAETRTASEAMQDMRDAVQHAAREITPLNKKSPDATERALQQVMREISAIAGHAKTGEEVIEGIKQWGKDGKAFIPGTTTRRPAIADHVLRLMTGRSLDEHTGRARDLSRQLAAEPKPPSVYESDTRGVNPEEMHAREADDARQERIDEGARGQDLMSTGEETSSGVSNYGGIEEKPLAKGTTNLKDIGDHWLNRVLGGRATVHEAAEAYGTQVIGKRARKAADFGAFLDQEIARALDPETAAGLKARLETDRERLHGQQLAAATKRDSALLKRTGEEYAAHLRTLKAELDPVGEAIHANYGEHPSSAALNHPIAVALNRAASEGRTLTLHPLLRMILGDKGIRDEAAPFAGLARRLLQIAPDIEVLTPDQALPRGMELSHYGSFQGRKRLGQYTPPGAYRSGDSAYIVVNTHTATPTETLLHEALHSITTGYIHNLTRTPNAPEFKAIMAIGHAINNIMVKPGSGIDSQTRGRANYALTNPHELHTMLMSSPEVQRMLSQHQATPELTARLRELGFDPGGESRSVWQTFTNWVRKVLGIDQKSGSVLDQILRPLQDITDKAAEHNDNLLPDDRVLRGYSEPLANIFTDTSRKARDYVDPMGLGDRARRGVLAGATTDGIVKWSRDLFRPSDRLAMTTNPLEAYRTATEAIGHGVREVNDKFIDRVRGLSGKLRTAGPDLAKLMNDATIAGARLDTPDAPAALQARFDALPASDKALYKATRDHYAETYRLERDAQLSAMVKTAMPDATPDQVAKLTEAVRTKKGIDELIKGADDSDLAKAFGTAWESRRAIVKGITKVHRLGFVEGDYFPLRRFGDYVVRYGSGENENLGVEMFERRGEAEARRNELLKADTEDLSQVLDRRQSKLHDIVPGNGLADEVRDAMRGHGMETQADAVRDLINSIVLEHATHSETVRTSMRRRGVEGASLDTARIMAREHLSLGSRMGYLQHGHARTAALRDMRLVTDDLGKHGATGEQIRAQAVLNELEKRVATGDDSFGGLVTAMRRASTFGFVQSLMSPSHMLTSTIETHMNSAALLGARFGVGRAGLALGKALADVSPRLLTAGAKNTIKAVGRGLQAADWNLAHLARDRLIAGGADRANMTDLFKRMDDAGLIDHTMVREMQRIANPGFGVTRAGKAWDKFMDFNAAGAHAVDVANKAAVAKAAYDLELRKTGDHGTAAAYAIETVRQVAPNYNLGNKARISTDKGPLGGFAGPITQFKQYGIHMYSVMANLAKASVHGASRDERMEARKAFAGILATHAAMAGVLTLIADPLRYVGGAYDFVTGADKPHDYQDDVRGWMADVFGKDAAELMARGLPHAAGIDIHNRVGLGNLLEVPELKSFDKMGALEMLGTALTGAAGQDAAAMAGGLGKIIRGVAFGDGRAILDGLQDTVPRIVRDPLKAMKLANHGVTDSKGKTILPADKLSNGDIAAQSLGFQPARVSEFREGRFAVMQARDEIKSERGHLTTSWLQAEPADRAAVMTQIRQFNMAHPHERITVEQLMKTLHEQKINARRSASTFGLTLPKKSARELANEGRFADVD